MANNTVIDGNIFFPDVLENEQLEVLSYQSATGQVVRQSSTAKRPASVDATHTFQLNINNSSNHIWEVEVGSATSGPNTGKVRVGHSSPGARNTSIFTAIAFNRTSSTGDRSNTLNYLYEGGTIAILNTAGATIADTLIIEEVDFSNANYVIVYVTVTSGTNADIYTSTSYKFDFQSGAYIPVPNKRYSRLAIKNDSGGASLNAILTPDANAVVGSVQTIEIVSVSGTNQFTVAYTKYLSGTGSSLTATEIGCPYFAGTNQYSLTLTYPGYAQAAIVNLQVHDIGGRKAFAHIGSDKIL